MRRFIVIFISFLITFSCSAQKSKKDKQAERRQHISTLAKQEEEGVITYKKSTVFGIKLTNDGYGAFLEIGRAKSVKKALLFQLDISERKHNKEVKEINPFIGQGPAFVFGKVNFFYPVKLGVQQQFLLGNKGNKNGVNITGNIGGGLTLGLLRPYEFEVDDSVGGRRNTRYENADTSYYLSADKLLGANGVGPTFGSGWGGITVNPGAYAKAALRFDYGRFNEVVSGLEVGITAEYYSKKVTQLAYVEPKSLFLNIYISIIFGKRK